MMMNMFKVIRLVRGVIELILTGIVLACGICFGSLMFFSPFIAWHFIGKYW